MDYQASLLYLESLAVFGSQLGLKRIERLTELLGHPENRYATVHVTGTNGKGSTALMTSAILTKAGLKTGLYISPHLLSYTERMRIDGQTIDEESFAAAVTKVRGAVDTMLREGLESPTEFEVLTAAAFVIFAEKKVDYAVIEVGLGGLLDSTNVIVPELSIITNVEMEHADRCGGTLEGIARHKAGIIKEGVPVVTAATGEPLDILRETAEEKSADMFVLGEDFSAKAENFDHFRQVISFSSPLLGVTDERFALRLLGTYQIKNAALAIMAAQILKQTNPSITKEAVAYALSIAEWPGRFERMAIGSQRILVDGAHNPAGMRALRDSLDSYYKEESRVFLLGILKDKEVEQMLHILFRPQDRVVLTRPQSERASDPEAIKAIADTMASEVTTCGSAEEALDRALSLVGEEDILICAGSLYLIGELRRLIKEKNSIASSIPVNFYLSE
ncbi:folylpolyglutamate synthase/dihydrofolate synthase family protein [Selenomonas sp. TAMA-11512]|uniref:bifunctional folylpolyglutamate synthase/dihydrofolate synthase n=1 Tax=Selenomonas sp. TAMA-11512 TaxID=3095337 RepID=UPI00308575E9|nr:folylpolyglutamate synthase/dihydrofolate synthase family protein [Selenomonas sp. TAMA-11512]